MGESLRSSVRFYLASGVGPLGSKQGCFSEVYTGNPSIILYSMFFLDRLTENRQNYSAIGP